MHDIDFAPICSRVAKAAATVARLGPRFVDCLPRLTCPPWPPYYAGPYPCLYFGLDCGGEDELWMQWPDSRAIRFAVDATADLGDLELLYGERAQDRPPASQWSNLAPRCTVTSWRTAFESIWCIESTRREACGGRSRDAHHYSAVLVHLCRPLPGPGMRWLEPSLVPSDVVEILRGLVNNDTVRQAVCPVVGMVDRADGADEQLRAQYGDQSSLTFTRQAMWSARAVTAATVEVGVPRWTDAWRLLYLFEAARSGDRALPRVHLICDQ